MITASIILAEAAVLFEDLIAVQSQTYGPQARGGATRSDVIISSSKINYPKVIQPNVLICLTQQAYDRFYPIIRPGGMLITDSRFVKVEKNVDAQHKELPMYRAVMEKIGRPIVFNSCMLGAVVNLVGCVKPESVMKSLEARIPPHFLEMNFSAFKLGMQLAKEIIS